MKFAKTIVTSAAVVALGFALAASAATFSNYMSVGSTGADVVQLQNWLIANNFSIPAITTGATSPGYYGSQTQAAVKAYQTSVGIPSLGMVGPLTLAALNRGSVASGSGSPTIAQYVASCPAGFTCPAPVAIGSVAGCPANTICTPNTGTVAGPTGITTPGVAGTLDIANGSIVGNGTSVNDGQEVDLGSISLQSGASDMEVTSASIDFNVRPWLYMSSLSVRDQSGKVLAEVDNLSANNFSEITVGSDYRITIPVNNLIIPKTTKVYAVVHAVFATSNRTATTVAITRASIRSVDGTGVTLTSDTGVLATSIMYVAYGGQQGSSIIVTTDPSSPKAGNVIQTSTGNTQTKNVLLGVWDFKSQNINSTLQGLTVNLNMNGVGSIGSTFAYVSLQSGSTVLNTGTPVAPTASTSAVTFSNFNLALPADQYIPVSVYATVNGAVTGITASTSLTAIAANITGIDSSSNNLTLSSSGTIPGGGVQTMSLSGSTLSALAWSLNGGNPTVPAGTSNKYPSQVYYNGSFTVQAGNNPIYLSTNGTKALTLATTSSSAVVLTDNPTVFAAADGTQSWDSAGSYYTINANSSRTFNITGVLALGASVSSATQVSASVGATAVNLSSTAGGVSSADIPITTQLQGLNSDFSKGSVFLNGAN